MDVGLERLVRVERSVEELEKDMAAVMRELGGVANGNGHQSVRTRLHRLESNDEGMRLVEQALRELREQREERRSIVSGWMGVIIVVFAGIGALGTVVAIITALLGGGA